MEIQPLIEAYRKNADAFYAAICNKKRRKKKKAPTKPNYRAEVIVPILNELIRLLPEYRLNPPDESYAMRSDYYHIHYGKLTVGGLQPDEDYNLTFTPLGKQKPIGPCVPIHSMDELVAQVRQTMAVKSTSKQTANPLKPDSQ